jgi:hypothetical protein
MPEGSLNVAVDRLIEDVSTKVLGKRKLEDDDTITVNGGVELPCNIFDRLRHGEWFDAWTIRAAMEMSDKPPFVRYGHSVPLDEPVQKTDENGEKRIIPVPVKRPLMRWGNKIREFRKAAQDMHGDEIRLVYLCPLNQDINHFTLLEINEREEKIRHYDSRARKGVIDGRTTTTRVRKLVQVSYSLASGTSTPLTGG